MWTPNIFEIALLLIPSLCFSRIAASRFSFSCTERAGEISGLAHFPDSGFCAKAASGRPRAPPKAVGTFRGRPRVLFRFLPQGHFPEPEGGTSGLLPFLPQGHFRKRKADLGVVLKAVGAFRTTSRRTSGVSKCRISIWLPLQTNLGGYSFASRAFSYPLQTPFRISLCIGATG